MSQFDSSSLKLNKILEFVCDCYEWHNASKSYGLTQLYIQSERINIK